MRICSLTHTYPRFPRDINAPFVESLMEYIAGKGNDVSVLTAYDPQWKRAQDDHTIDLRTYRYIWPDSLHILAYSRTIEGNIRFRKRVLLLAPFLFLGAYRAFLKLVREKKPDILHAHWLLPNGFIAGLVSRMTGIPLIIQTHGSDIFTSEKNALFRAMARYAGSRAHYIVVPSPEHIERLEAIGLDRDKIGLVPNTVEADFSADVTPEDVASLKRKLGISPGKKVVLAMGRMVHVKGFDYLLRAFRTIADRRSDVMLVLAGSGVLFDDMKKMSHKLGIGDRVIMPGAVMRDDVPVYFRMADIFVVPSVRHESGAVDGLPVVVPEAMAAGLPVVASNVGGIPVVIRDGYNGVLVPERNAEALSVAIDSLLDDHVLGKQYGERSQRIIETGVNYVAVSNHFCRLYEEITVRHTPHAEMPSFKIPMG